MTAKQPEVVRSADVTTGAPVDRNLGETLIYCDGSSVGDISPGETAELGSIPLVVTQAYQRVYISATIWGCRNDPEEM